MKVNDPDWFFERGVPKARRLLYVLYMLELVSRAEVWWAKNQELQRYMYRQWHAYKSDLK